MPLKDKKIIMVLVGGAFTMLLICNFFLHMHKSDLFMMQMNIFSFFQENAIQGLRLKSFQCSY